MQIGGNDFNSHPESWKLPILVKSSLNKTEEKKKTQLFKRLKRVIGTFKSIIFHESQNKTGGIKYFF